MDLIDEFIARYTRELDFYEQVGRLASQLLERRLQEAGVRGIVTYRAKSIVRLRDKCIARMPRKNYQTVEDIYDDIVDLVGIRVALYFPGEQVQVETIIRDLFEPTEERRDFPESSEPREDRRFAGYKAYHYRVTLRSSELAESEVRYSLARIEIQVASLLMHAWSEVDHDLDYKPTSGTLSRDEQEILDQLNGLVMAGEIALERLQEAGERRVAAAARFANHYDLATYILAKARQLSEQPITESDIGRVNLLYALLQRLEIVTPNEIEPFLASLHDDYEARPLAEQIIDAILSTDSFRYEVFAQVRRDFDGDRADSFRDVGEFMTKWIELERLIRDATPDIEPRYSISYRLRAAFDQGLVDEILVPEIDSLRRLRNSIVHGLADQEPAELQGAVSRLNTVIAEVQRRTEGPPRLES